MNALHPLLLTAGFLVLAFAPAQGAETDYTFFERKIRPVLVKNCYECHSASAEKLKGGLLLDSKTGWQAGGDSGQAIVPGKPDASPLLQSIAHHQDFPEMPPKVRLPDSVVTDFRNWIASGAPDPREGEASARPARSGIDIGEGRKFWAFQPRKTIGPPAVAGGDWPQNAIDRFILAKLEKSGLSPSPDAESHVIARRLYFDLTGLPPTPEQLDHFAESAIRNPQSAIEALVDELLRSPQFGEKWARHWLDLARYADSNGGDINLTFPNSWRYRKYVVDAINSDKPYDQFIREQIAGDLLPFESGEQRAERLIATGFLIIGSKMLSERDKEKMHLDVADEQIDTVGRVFLGLTLGCARCHDHKFDPVPTRDYYAMAGIFRSTHAAYGIRMGNVNVSGWIERDLPMPKDRALEIAAYRKEKEGFETRIKELKKKIEPLKKAAGMADSIGIVVDNTEARVTGTWKASTFSKNYIGAGYIHDDKLDKGKLSVIWQAKIPADGEYEVRISYPGSGGRDGKVPFTVKHAGGEETIMVDQSTKAPIGGLWEVLGRFSFKQGSTAEVTLSNRDTSGYVIADAARFIAVADLEKAKTKPQSEAGARYAKVAAELKKAESALKELDKNAPKIPRTMAAEDREPDEIGDTHIRVRGEPRNLGDKVPRGFLQVLDRPDQPPPGIAEDQSGRRELADWIAGADNPLTARVIVNRIWQHLFGEGLVRSVDNFGLLGDRPSHPDLLDWLAEDFVAHGGSIKHTVRQIVTSRTWRLSTECADGESDPENRLLGRQNRRALSAESIRDALLAISGSLDLEPPQSSVSHLGDQAISNSAKQDGSSQTNVHRKRSLYLPMVRNDMPPFLETFDMANPDMVTGRRNTTTVPAQALLMLNAEFVRKMAAATVESIGSEDENAVILELYRRILGRAPSHYEAANARAYVAELEAEESLSEDDALASFAQVLFASTEFRYLD